MVSEEELVLELKKILSSADLDTVTEKDVRRTLADVLGEPMDGHKALIRAEVKAYLANLERGKKRKSHIEEDVEEGDEVDELENQPRKLPRTDSDTSCVVELGDMNFLMVRVFKGRKLIDIRSHYEGKNGDLRPGKGVTLNLQEFNAICENREPIEQALSDVDESLIVDVGRMRRVTISTFRGVKIDIREHYEKDGDVRPTQKGCSLSLSSFEKLVGSQSQISEEWGPEQPVVRPSQNTSEGKRGAFPDPDLTIQLGPKLRASVSEWKGTRRVDFREVYEKDGQKLPTKKGISLPPDQWNKIMKKIDAATTAFEDIDEHFVIELGPKRRMRVGVFKGKAYIDLREYYEKNGKEQPGQKGVRFYPNTWQVLQSNIEKIDRAVHGG